MASQIFHLTIDKNLPEEGIIKLISLIKPQWNNDLNIKKLKGGKSCLTYTCHQENSPDDAVIVRIKGLIASSPMDNSKFENKVLKVVSESGLFSKVNGIFSNGYCYDFIKGRTLLSSNFPFEINDKQFESIAKTIAKIHSVRIEGVMNYTHTTYFSRLQNVTECDYKERKDLPNKQELKQELDFMEKTIKELNLPLVLCHGDFHPGNMIWNDKTGTISLVDWELSHIGYREAELDYFLQELEVIEHYIKKPVVVPENIKEKFVRYYLEHTKNGNSDAEVSKQKVDQFISAMRYFDLVFCLYYIIITSAYNDELVSDSFNPVNLAKNYYDKYLEKKKELSQMQDLNKYL